MPSPMRMPTLLRAGCALSCLLALACRAGPPVLDIAAESLLSACTIKGARHSPRRGQAVASPDATLVFQAEYDAADWSGRFVRYALAMQAGQAIAGPVQWDAGAILTGTGDQAARPAPARRNIYTSAYDADGNWRVLPFEWEALGPAQRALLDEAPTLPGKRARADALGEQRLAYLRGERDREGRPFRPRSSVLGDSVHANPVYVGAAAAGLRGAGYAAFFQRSKARRPMLYLGANDGMLHGFDAGDGSEVFAYVPAALFGALNELTSPAYAHRAYVDGPASAGEALVGGSWKTVLLSGMGGGAQGLFALDVSDPAHLDGSAVLWEFSDRDDPAMGNVTGLPQIARLRTRQRGAVAEYRYFAVVASGLNNYADDGHRTAAGKGALFLLALDKPAQAPWRLNDNYYRLLTPISDPALANGLAAPALVGDGDGVLRYAYAGDLQGNLWRFDFDGGAPWSDAVGPGPGRTPLFVARDAGGRRQPVTAQARVVYTEAGGYLVLFGTGQLVTAADRQPQRFAPQSLYAIEDSLEQPARIVASRRELGERRLSADGDGYAIRAAERAAGDKGWYIDFPQSEQSGERSVDSASLLAGKLILNTVLPGRDACTPALSRSYLVDALSGEASATARFGPEYVSTPLLLRPESAAISAVQGAGLVHVLKTFSMVRFSADQPGRLQATTSVTVTLPAGRLSWREIANWRELHAGAKP